jgi:hypothetical protein
LNHTIDHAQPLFPSYHHLVYEMKGGTAEHHLGHLTELQASNTEKCWTRRFGELGLGTIPHERMGGSASSLFTMMVNAGAGVAIARMSDIITSRQRPP